MQDVLVRDFFDLPSRVCLGLTSKQNFDLCRWEPVINCSLFRSLGESGSLALANWFVEHWDRGVDEEEKEHCSLELLCGAIFGGRVSFLRTKFLLESPQQAKANLDLPLDFQFVFDPWFFSYYTGLSGNDDILKYLESTGVALDLSEFARGAYGRNKSSPEILRRYITDTLERGGPLTSSRDSKPKRELSQMIALAFGHLDFTTLELLLKYKIMQIMGGDVATEIDPQTPSTLWGTTSDHYPWFGQLMEEEDAEAALAFLERKGMTLPHPNDDEIIISLLCEANPSILSALLRRSDLLASTPDDELLVALSTLGGGVDSLGFVLEVMDYRPRIVNQKTASTVLKASVDFIKRREPDEPIDVALIDAFLTDFLDFLIKHGIPVPSELFKVVSEVFWEDDFDYSDLILRIMSHEPQDIDLATLSNLFSKANGITKKPEIVKRFAELNPTIETSQLAELMSSSVPIETEKPL